MLGAATVFLSLFFLAQNLPSFPFDEKYDPDKKTQGPC
jgi:hypothetical protein